VHQFTASIYLILSNVRSPTHFQIRTFEKRIFAGDVFIQKRTNHYAGASLYCWLNPVLLFSCLDPLQWPVENLTMKTPVVTLQILSFPLRKKKLLKKRKASSVPFS